MEITPKLITELIPYENNPRRNEKAVNYVANSIREFGFKVPIVIDKNNIIVCGHTRLKAAKLLGMDSVPCVLADDLTEDEIRAYRIADNKTNELAGWKTKMLQEELKALGSFDVEAFGFASVEAAESLIDQGDNSEDAEETVKMVRCPHCGAMHEAKKVRVKYD